ncbi:MAG: hypothetical protein V3574_04310 [Candidatus Moraniibacteriota bacterium]
MKNIKENYKTIVNEAIGEASMCWTETPKGVFVSERAIKISDKLVETIEKEKEKARQELKEELIADIKNIRAIDDNGVMEFLKDIVIKIIKEKGL